MLNIASETREPALSGKRLLRGHIRRFRAHEYLIRCGQTSSELHIVLDGWAARYKQLPDGRRQITAIYLKGDLCDPSWLSPSSVRQPVVAMRRLRTASIEADDVHSCAEENACLTRVILDETRIALDVQAEWLIGLGRKTARERLAHLLCEIGLRLGLVLSSKAARYDLPLTQSEMADFTGLTSVHVNRTLKDMRLEQLIEQHGQTLHIPDMLRLARAGLYSPGDQNIGKRLRDFVLLQPDFATA